MERVAIPGFADPDLRFVPRDAGAAAIRYAADSGAQVINISIGGPYPSPIYLDALRYAVQRGAFVTISAGNSAEEGNPVEYPAAYAAQIDGVMAVGAVGPSGKRAFYSNTGALCGNRGAWGNRKGRPIGTGLSDCRVQARLRPVPDS